MVNPCRRPGGFQRDHLILPELFIWGAGSTPVVSTFYTGYGGPSPYFILVYAAQDGLDYETMDGGDFSWSGVVGTVPGTLNNSTVWHPSLATYDGQSHNVYLIYDDRFSHVYSQIWQNDYGTWTSQNTIDWTGYYNRYTSLALDYAYSTYAVWSGQTSSLTQYYLRFRQGWSDGTWSSWYQEWDNIPESVFYPVISYYYASGQSYPNRLDILAWGSGQDIWQLKYLGLGNDWSGPTEIETNSYVPNLTHEREGSGSPVQAYVDLSQSPYQIETGTWGLPKVGTPLAFQITRAAVIYDKVDHSTLRVELSEPQLTTLSGDTIAIPFKEYNYADTLALSTSNIFNYLQSDSVTIPSDAMDLSFSATVTIGVPDTLTGGKLNSDKPSVFSGVSFGVNAFDGASSTPLLSNRPISGTVTSGRLKVSAPITLSLQSLRGKTLSFVPISSVPGDFNDSDLAFSLVNIVKPASASGATVASSNAMAVLPENAILGQNYPNPFNPTTNIAYRIAQPGHVTLKVYDILGREVATLVSEDQFAGVHTAAFDASRLASGIYFYRLSAPGINKVKKMLLLK